MTPPWGLRVASSTWGSVILPFVGRRARPSLRAGEQPRDVQLGCLEQTNNSESPGLPGKHRCALRLSLGRGVASLRRPASCSAGCSGTSDCSPPGHSLPGLPALHPPFFFFSPPWLRPCRVRARVFRTTRGTERRGRCSRASGAVVGRPPRVHSGRLP